MTRSQKPEPLCSGPPPFWLPLPARCGGAGRWGLGLGDKRPLDWATSGEKGPLFGPSFPQEEVGHRGDSAAVLLG